MCCAEAIAPLDMRSLVGAAGWPPDNNNTIRAKPDSKASNHVRNAVGCETRIMAGVVTDRSGHVVRHVRAAIGCLALGVCFDTALSGHWTSPSPPRAGFSIDDPVASVFPTPRPARRHSRWLKLASVGGNTLGYGKAQARLVKTSQPLARVYHQPARVVVPTVYFFCVSSRATRSSYGRTAIATLTTILAVR
jgi:hypothetical protein